MKLCKLFNAINASFEDTFKGVSCACMTMNGINDTQFLFTLLLSNV